MLVINSAGVVNSIPDKEYDGRWYYVAHNLKDMDVRILCPICKKEFYEVSKYIEHMKKHKKEEKKAIETVDEIKEETTKSRGRPPKK